MPGKGRVTQREWTPEERERIGEETLAGLGEACYDVHLNAVACWRGVPAGVWDYTLGDYQVVKKWLSYREKPLLGRPLTSAEVREVTATVRRITEILLMAPALDTNDEAIKA